jgi:hypothetical protein
LLCRTPLARLPHAGPERFEPKGILKIKAGLSRLAKNALMNTHLLTHTSQQASFFLEAPELFRPTARELQSCAPGRKLCALF